MPFSYKNCDCSPLVFDREFDIHDEDLLAEYVGRIVLGHFSHIKRIINSLSTVFPNIADNDIDLAINRLQSIGKKDKDIEKRDGWVFQMISWLALFKENVGKKFYCQQPHDAPAQHGLDGVALTLSSKSEIECITITEDKCTENHRVVIPQIWLEFKEFENGDHNNKLVSRLSALIEHLDEGDVLAANQNDIYRNEFRKYRVGINRNDSYETEPKRKKLFKGYDGCVLGDDPHRRFASTLHKNDIRDWMESFCVKVIEYLEAQKSTHV